MRGEIIAIGDELITGRVINTTSGFAARNLFASGHQITHIHTVGDVLEGIGRVLNQVLERSEFVIITGGLGSTSDDITNEAVVTALGYPWTVHPEVAAAIRARHPEQDSPHLEKMAWLPEGAEVFDCGSRMAGYQLVHQGKPLFFLPGVPSQMEYLMVRQVLPRLNRLCEGIQRPALQQIFRTFGLREIEINDRLLALEGQDNIRIGYYPVGCEVHVSLTVRDTDPQREKARFTAVEEQLRRALGKALYGTGEETMAAAVGKLLLKRGETLVVAESCTGGLISTKITQVPGCSAWYLGGVTAYANTLKEALLGVEPELIASCGAVSSRVAWAMAARPAEALGATLGLSTTGIAGPDGGTPEKPVGTVHIGLYQHGRVQDQLFRFAGSRAQIQEHTAITALDILRRALLAAQEGKEG